MKCLDSPGSHLIVQTLVRGAGCGEVVYQSVGVGGYVVFKRAILFNIEMYPQQARDASHRCGIRSLCVGEKHFIWAAGDDCGL